MRFVISFALIDLGTSFTSDELSNDPESFEIDSSREQVTFVPQGQVVHAV
jgi:hypothetical protein